MKYQLAKPFLFLIAVILVVSLACSIGGSTEAPVAPDEQPVAGEQPVALDEQPVEQAPVEDAEPTAPPPPTNTPEPVAQQFFTETFDENSGNWSYFMVNGSLSTVTDGFGKNNVAIEGGRYVFKLEDKYQWAYVKYDPYEYENVRVQIVAENRGANNNNVSIICRYTPDVGWYEFNIANNGLYWIYYAEYREQGTKVRYNYIINGGSNKIHTGKETNTYTAICDGRTLSLEINGFETNSIEEKQYVLRQGSVGVAVSSFNVLPINVEIDEVTISEP